MKANRVVHRNSLRAPATASPTPRLTVAEEEALREAVDRAMEGVSHLVQGTGRRAAPPREARGVWESAVAVVRSWRARAERRRDYDARFEERRDSVRRELLLRDPRLW